MNLCVKATQLKKVKKYKLARNEGGLPARSNRFRQRLCLYSRLQTNRCVIRIINLIG